MELASHAIVILEDEESRPAPWLALHMTGLYFALYIIRPWESLGPFEWMSTIRFERLYICGLLAALFFAGTKLRPNGLNLAVAMFGATVCLSTALAWNVNASWKQFYQYLPVLITYVALMFVVQRPRDLIHILTWYLVGMGLYMAKSQWEYFVHGAKHGAQGVLRMKGIDLTFGDPNHFALAAVVSLPFAYLAFQQRHRIASDWSAHRKRIWTAYAVIYGVLGVTTIFLTHSRAAVIALVTFVGLLAIQNMALATILRRALLGATFVALVWMVLPADSQNRIRTIWDPSAGPSNAHSSAVGRIEGFWAGVEIFRDRPFTGIGLGTFASYRKAHVDGVYLFAHNLPGQLLGESGMLGTAAFAGLVFVALRTGLRLYKLRHLSDDDDVQLLSHLGLACVQGLILMLVEGLALHNAMRAQWIWFGAFAVIGLQLCRDRLLDIELAYLYSQRC